jgi:lytic murein transglycosylase
VWQEVVMRVASKWRAAPCSTVFMSLCAVLLALCAAPAYAQVSEDFYSFLTRLGGMARAQGVSQHTIDAVIPTLVFQSRVVDLDRAQPGGRPDAPIPKFAPYRWRHVDAQRIARGRNKYQLLRGNLARIENETGVPESIMIAIWGNETNYGAFTGNFDLARALASLAYEGRRRDLFTTEFIATLKLMDRGIPRETLRGSWAGATGLPQFLPSQYLLLGKDGDGDGRVDIWNNESDALASIANYFLAHGWRRGLPWAVAATAPANFNPSAYASNNIGQPCQKVMDRLSRYMPVHEWRALGVVPLGGKYINENEMASLIQPDGPGTPAWLTTSNYRAILSYNCSNFYGLSVGILSDAVEK